MPSLVIGGNLPVQTRQLISILLLIICAAFVGAILAYFVGKTINLYREHKHNQKLAKRAVDIEVRNSPKHFANIDGIIQGMHVEGRQADFREQSRTPR